MAYGPRRGRAARWARRLVVLVVLVLAGGYGLALLAVRGGGPVLEVWHTEILEAEFTAERAGDIRTLADYLRLEDALFQELDEKVFDRVPTGPGQTLNRYSADSAADPRARPRDWNRTFQLEADAPLGGVLLLHGLTDAPYSLRALGEAYRRRGYHVLGLRLPGHGTAPSGLMTVRWQDMTAAVAAAAGALADRVGGKPIHIVGYSTGAPLAVFYTLDALEGLAGPVPSSLVLVSPAVGVHPTAALAGAKARLAALPGLGAHAWLSIVPEFDPFKYNSFPTNGAAQVFALTRRVAERVRNRAADSPDKVLPPTIVFKSTVDATVTNDALIDNLLGLLAPARHELVLFDINRFAVKSDLMLANAAPLSERVMQADDLPVTVSFLTNRTPDSRMVRVDTKPPRTSSVSRSEPLNAAWTPGLISLSHVALPFPPDDPLYGRRPPDNRDVLFLGEMALRGERGLLRFPDNWLMRLRYNPFYGYLETRALDWVEDNSPP